MNPNTVVLGRQIATDLGLYAELTHLALARTTLATGFFLLTVYPLLIL